MRAGKLPLQKCVRSQRRLFDFLTITIFQKMKNKVILSVASMVPLCLSSFMLGAQRLEVMSSGGQNLVRRGLSITATIGEVCVAETSNHQKAVTGGFQQGFLSGPIATTDREEQTVDIPAIALFPNPATDRVQVSLQHFKGASVRLRLFNSLGSLIQETETNHDFYAFDIRALAAGSYWISMSRDTDQTPVTLPFSKINH